MNRRKFIGAGLGLASLAGLSTVSFNKGRKRKGLSFLEERGGMPVMKGWGEVMEKLPQIGPALNFSDGDPRLTSLKDLVKKLVPKSIENGFEYTGRVPKIGHKEVDEAQGFMRNYGVHMLGIF
jgi:hypothetical protein